MLLATDLDGTFFAVSSDDHTTFYCSGQFIQDTSLSLFCP